MIRRQIRVRMRVLVRRARRYLYHDILHADDPPHRLAMGAAIGMFITFTPTVGIQMVLTVFLSWLFRANKVIGLPIVWISNPATIVPIYYSCYRIGRAIMGWSGVGRGWWLQLTDPPSGWWSAITFYWAKLIEVAAPLWLGSLILAFVLAYPTYYLVYHTLRVYRMRRWGQLTPPPRANSR